MVILEVFLILGLMQGILIGMARIECPQEIKNDRTTDFRDYT